MDCTSFTASGPGTSPVRLRPISTSTSTSRVMPWAAAALARSATCRGSSTRAMTCTFFARFTRRSILALPTTCSIIRMCRAPAATMTSASLTFAQQSPNGTAPSVVICR